MVVIERILQGGQTRCEQIRTRDTGLVRVIFAVLWYSEKLLIFAAAEPSQ